MNRQDMNGEKIFPKHQSEDWLLSRMYKELPQLSNKKTNNLIQLQWFEYPLHRKWMYEWSISIQ